MKKITIEELSKWLSENEVSGKKLFTLIDTLSLENIPSLSWRYEDKHKSLEILVDLVNEMKLTIPIDILKLMPSKDKISIEIFDTTYYVLSKEDTKIVDKIHAFVIKRLKGEDK